MHSVLLLAGAVFCASLTFEELRRNEIMTIASIAISREQSPVLYWLNIAAHFAVALILLIVLTMQIAS